MSVNCNKSNDSSNCINKGNCLMLYAPFTTSEFHHDKETGLVNKLSNIMQFNVNNAMPLEGHSKLDYL